MKAFVTAGLFIFALALAGCGGNGGTPDAHDDTTTADTAGDVIDDAADDAITPDDTGRDNAGEDAGEDVDDDTVVADASEVIATDEGAEIPVVPEPPHANCGMPAYDFVPPGELGNLVESENISMLTLDAETINNLLANFDFSAMSPVPYGTVTYRFRYTTQDRGQQVEATGLMAFPASTEPITEPLPILVYQHGTSGFSDPCAPSNEAYWFEDGALGPAVASLGFVVIAPDYIGMNGWGAPSTVKHGYLVGEQTAIGAWDAVRGGLELFESIEGHPPVSNDVVLWGISQGAHASMFTELWGGWYAPEYDVKAVVALVPPTDLLALLKTALSSMSDSTGMLAVAIVAMNLWYGEQANLDLMLTDEEPYFVATEGPKYLFPTDECKIAIGDGVDIEDLTLEMLFQQTLLDAIATEDWPAIAPWNCFFVENTLSSTSVVPPRHTPTLMVYGEIDDMVVTPTQRPDFQKLCEAGYKLDYLECANASHARAALWSLPEQFQWIRDRLAGIPIPEEELCQIQEPVTCSATAE